MLVRRVEHIYFSSEDWQLWSDFGDLLINVQRNTENKEVATLTNDIITKLFDLSNFIEREE